MEEQVPDILLFLLSFFPPLPPITLEHAALTDSQKLKWMNILTLN